MRSRSPRPVLSRRSSDSAGTWLAGTGREALLVPPGTAGARRGSGAASGRTSTKLFHSPQSPQRPNHFGERAPQEEHSNWIFFAAMVRIGSARSMPAPARDREHRVDHEGRRSASGSASSAGPGRTVSDGSGRLSVRRVSSWPRIGYIVIQQGALMDPRPKPELIPNQARSVRLRDFSSRPMRAFHVTWASFFVCFFAWFGVAP